MLAYYQRPSLFKSLLSNEVKISCWLDRETLKHKTDLVTSLELVVCMVLCNYHFPHCQSSSSIVVQAPGLVGPYGLRLGFLVRWPPSP